MNLSKFKERFEHESVKVMRDFNVPGMSILVTKDGETIYERSFGLRKRGDVKEATTDTLFGVSSITKSVTDFAILQLYEEGKLDLLDPISNHLPVEIGIKDQPIKIHDLMCHGSGVPSLMTFYMSQMNQQLYKPKPPLFPLGNWDDYYFHINDASSEVLSPPGTKYYYFNAGFTLLGQIVEKVSGIPFEQYIKEKILQPLNMNRSTFAKIDVDKDEDASAGFAYEWSEDRIKRHAKQLLTDKFIAGSGGLISSVKEMTNFLLCQLNGGEYQGTRLLSEELIHKMWEPHNKNIQASSYEMCPGSTTAYGYGWKIYDNYHGYQVITHQGVSGVTGGNVAIIPELNITFAQLYNVSWIPSHLMHNALTLLLDKDPDEDMPFYIRRKHYKKLCGRYDAYKKTISLTIENKGGMLYLIDDNWPDKTVTPLIPKNDDPEVMDFYVILPQGNMNIPFTQLSDDHLIFEYERYIVHKKTIELEEENV